MVLRRYVYLAKVSEIGCVSVRLLASCAALSMYSVNVDASFSDLLKASSLDIESFRL